VLSILTGLDTDECADAIRRVNGQYEVAGVIIGDLLKAANKLGYSSVAVNHTRTLYGTLVNLAYSDGIYIVIVPNHYVCIEIIEGKIHFCDGQTREPIPAGSSARLSQTVLGCYKVIKKFDVTPKPKPVVPVITKSYIRIERSIYDIIVVRVSDYSDGAQKIATMGSIRCDSAQEALEVAANIKVEILEEE
jgi:hypothetical protein